MLFAEKMEKFTSLVNLATNYLPADLQTELNAFIDSATQRKNLGLDYSVVAFAGGTGAGKSSLFNAVSQQNLAQVTPIRPTTSVPMAISASEATDILDWLDIKQRHVVAEFAQSFSGLKSEEKLVLLDLPDIDSTNMQNQEIAKFLTQRVDVLVWVLDPQKYADAVLHEDYLRNMRAHAEVTLIVLNQCDTLGSERAQVLNDVARVVRESGIDADIIPTSAVTGEGISELRTAITKIVNQREVAYRRLIADLFAFATRIETTLPDDFANFTAQISKTDMQELGIAVADSAGVKEIAQVCADSYTYHGKKQTGWIVSRLLLKNKIDPLRRFKLGSVKNENLQSAAPDVDLVVSNVQPEAHAQVRLAASTTNLVRKYGEQMPTKWGNTVATKLEETVSDTVDIAHSQITTLEPAYMRTPFSWKIFNFLQGILLLSAIVGGVWIALLNLADFITLKLPDPPVYGIFSLPLLLLVGGILGGWLIALLFRPLIRFGAGRRYKRVRSALTKRVQKVVATNIIVPLETELNKYQQFIKLLSNIRS